MLNMCIAFTLRLHFTARAVDLRIRTRTTGVLANTEQPMSDTSQWLRVGVDLITIVTIKCFPKSLSSTSLIAEYSPPSPTKRLTADEKSNEGRENRAILNEKIFFEIVLFLSRTSIGAFPLPSYEINALEVSNDLAFSGRVPSSWWLLFQWTYLPNVWHTMPAKRQLMAWDRCRYGYSCGCSSSKIRRPVPLM